MPHSYFETQEDGITGSREDLVNWVNTKLASASDLFQWDAPNTKSDIGGATFAGFDEILNNFREGNCPQRTYYCGGLKDPTDKIKFTLSRLDGGKIKISYCGPSTSKTKNEFNPDTFILDEKPRSRRKSIATTATSSFEAQRPQFHHQEVSLSQVPPMALIDPAR